MRPFSTVSALLLGCSLFTASLQAAAAADFWNDLDPTAEPVEWAAYAARAPQLEAKVWKLLRSAPGSPVRVPRSSGRSSRIGTPR